MGDGSEGSAGKLKVLLLGPFQIIGPDGRDLTPRRQKANALLALVAVAHRGQRARSWLCSRLWSDRSQEQALGSMRQSLTDLRRALGADWDRYLHIDAFNVAIDFSSVWVDAVALRERDAGGLAAERGEFLEGMDIGDDEFEDWLLLERSYWQELREERRRAPQALPQLPALVEAHPASGAVTLSMGRHRIEIRILEDAGDGETAAA
ncbi:MAG: hypothetical protein IPK28_16075 [Devosia sp.]|nr:hypothetical protein [Devosia sp.]